MNDVFTSALNRARLAVKAGEPTVGACDVHVVASGIGFDLPTQAKPGQYDVSSVKQMLALIDKKSTKREGKQ